MTEPEKDEVPEEESTGEEEEAAEVLSAPPDDPAFSGRTTESSTEPE
ncbi:hypothetical protein [Longispora albida]|nr:hypothetical protein [Longispora albida]